METDDTQERFLALLEESAKREQELKRALIESRWSQESAAAKAANLEVKFKESERRNAGLERRMVDMVNIAKMAKAYFDEKRDGRGIEDPLWHAARKVLEEVES